MPSLTNSFGLREVDILSVVDVLIIISALLGLRGVKSVNNHKFYPIRVRSDFFKNFKLKIAEAGQFVEKVIFKIVW